MKGLVLLKKYNFSPFFKRENKKRDLFMGKQKGGNPFAPTKGGNTGGVRGGPNAPFGKQRPRKKQ